MFWDEWHMRIRMNTATKDVRPPTSTRGVTWSHMSLLSHQVLRTEAQRRKASSPSAKSTVSSTFGKCQCEGPPCPSMRTFRDWTKVTPKIQGPSVDTKNSMVNMPSTLQSRRCYPFSPLWSATSTNAEQHSSWPNFQKKNQSQSDSFSQIKVKGCKGQNCFMISCWPQFLAEPFQPAHCVVFQTTPESSHAVHWAEKGELRQSV